MQSRAPYLAKASRVNHPSWHVGFIDKGNMRYPAREVWIKRGGMGHSGSGPSGWKVRPAKALARSLADRRKK